MPVHVEKRFGEPRQLSGATGRVYYGDRRAVCIVEDQSAGGSRIRINMDVDLPRRFALEGPSGEFAQVCVVWQRGDLVGVRHVDEAAASFLRQMWEWLGPASRRAA